MAQLFSNEAPAILSTQNGVVGVFNSYSGLHKALQKTIEYYQDENYIIISATITPEDDEGTFYRMIQKRNDGEVVHVIFDLADEVVNIMNNYAPERLFIEFTLAPGDKELFKENKDNLGGPKYSRNFDAIHSQDTIYIRIEVLQMNQIIEEAI